MTDTIKPEYLESKKEELSKVILSAQSADNDNRREVCSHL